MRISIAVRDLVTRVENRSNKPAAAYLAVLRKSGGAGRATAKGVPWKVAVIGSKPYLGARVLRRKSTTRVSESLAASASQAI